MSTKFQGSKNYVATQDLMLAVNAAATLQRPLLVKGEPGTGKTMLAEEVAQALGMPLLQWHIKSTTKAQQGLYEYDAVSRLRDSQLGGAENGDNVKDIRNYILRGVIETQATRNLMVNVNQVNINMAFTLTGANGKLISQTSASNASYAGADTSGMALTLINESADEVVATLYSDYCRRAGTQ